jgi:hypothetical protein
MEYGSDVEVLETAFPAAIDDVISSKLAIRRRRMDALAAIIGLDEETTSILLRHCGGDEDRMLERYFVVAKGLLLEAVIQDTAAVQDFTLESAAGESKEEELPHCSQVLECERALGFPCRFPCSVFPARIPFQKMRDHATRHSQSDLIVSYTCRI